MTDETRPWKCEECQAIIGHVSEGGMRCEVVWGLTVIFRGMSGWVRCRYCRHESPWTFEAELLKSMLLDKVAP